MVVRVISGSSSRKRTPDRRGVSYNSAKRYVLSILPDRGITPVYLRSYPFNTVAYPSNGDFHPGQVNIFPQKRARRIIDLSLLLFFLEMCFFYYNG